MDKSDKKHHSLKNLTIGSDNKYYATKLNKNSRHNLFIYFFWIHLQYYINDLKKLLICLIWF